MCNALLVKGALSLTLAIDKAPFVFLSIWPFIYPVSVSQPVLHFAYILASVYPVKAPMAILLPIAKLPLVDVALRRDDTPPPVEFVVAEPALVEGAIFLNEDTAALSDVWLGLPAMDGG